ncbi:hypothetical protein ARNL5_01726 [Anaerolineae bacterium]|nr:hypothetical protein ARNL5_01726 [Anaerolineae bacterium]
MVNPPALKTLTGGVVFHRSIQIGIFEICNGSFSRLSNIGMFIIQQDLEIWQKQLTLLLNFHLNFIHDISCYFSWNKMRVRNCFNQHWDRIAWKQFPDKVDDSTAYPTIWMFAKYQHSIKIFGVSSLPEIMNGYCDEFSLR